jgi:hypothetical protein
MIAFCLPPDSPGRFQFYHYFHIAATMALEIGIASKLRVSWQLCEAMNHLESFDEQMAEQTSQSCFAIIPHPNKHLDEV